VAVGDGDHPPPSPLSFPTFAGCDMESGVVTLIQESNRFLKIKRVTIERPAILLPVALAGCLAGLAGGMDPLAACLGALVLIMAAVAIVNLTVAVAAFTVLSVAYFGAAPNKAFAAGLLVAFAWWLVRSGDRSGRRSLLASQRGFTWLVLGFLAWLSLSVVWAYDSSAAMQALGRYALVLFLFPAVFAAVQTRAQVILVVGALVVAAAGSTVYQLISTPSGGPRFGGPTADPNTFAAVLLPAAILGAALASRRVRLSTRWRVLLRLAAATALGGVLATESRGALIAIVVVLIALPLVAGHWRGRALALSLSALALACVFIAIPGSPVVSAFQGRGLGTSGRSDLWTVAWRMVESKPLGGVGVGNFRNTSAQYLLRPGAIRRSQYILDNPLVAHNSFLQVAAETGLVGGAIFIAIAAVAMASAWRAARRFEEAGDQGLELIARAVVLGIIAMLTTLVFLTFTDYGRPFWILLALGPALLEISRSRARQPSVAVRKYAQDWPARTRTARTFRWTPIPPGPVSGS
jgi:O-antigen ligase